MQTSDHISNTHTSKKIYETIKAFGLKLGDTFFGFTRETSAHFRLRFEKAGLPVESAPTITLLINCAMVFIGFILYTRHE